MPQPTDLVTDLPADFEVFGQAVATSMADLLGGTSGQVLAKNSNTDMDFVWVTSDDANAIQNTIVDAKGDLIAASAADTPARLAVGSNGETIVADSSTSTGLRYQVPVNVNPVLNSAFQIGQRGTTFNNVATTTTYTLDRWCYYTNAAAADYTISRQATGDTTNLPNIQYAMRVQRNNTKTTTSSLSMTQSIETLNAIPFAGKTVTLSFYARKGANYSAASSILSILLESGTGTDQNILSGFTGQATVNGTSGFTLTSTWQRFTVTGTVAATATELALTHYYIPSGTAGAADYYDITGIQIEVGSVATPFKTNGATFQGELAACQRYYWRAANSTNYSVTLAVGRSSTIADVQLALPVTMRIAPTAIEYSGTTDLTDPNVAGYNATSLTFSNASNSFVKLQVNTASGLAQGKVYIWGTQGTAYFAFSGEL